MLHEVVEDRDVLRPAERLRKSGFPCHILDALNYETLFVRARANKEKGDNLD